VQNFATGAFTDTSEKPVKTAVEIPPPNKAFSGCLTIDLPAQFTLLGMPKIKALGKCFIQAKSNA